MFLYGYFLRCKYMLFYKKMRELLYIFYKKMRELLYIFYKKMRELVLEFDFNLYDSFLYLCTLQSKRKSC